MTSKYLGFVKVLKAVLVEKPSKVDYLVNTFFISVTPSKTHLGLLGFKNLVTLKVVRYSFTQ